MALNINSPAYYTSHHGIVEEIYQMCNNISRAIDIGNYTSSFDSIGITPIIAPSVEITSGKWEEVKKILVKSRIAIISLHIDYEVYYAADTNKKKELILQNIFESLMLVHKKLKEDFNYEKLIADIKKIV